MNKKLYNAIFKRKSFHTFRERNDEHITEKEIEDIYNAFSSFDKLFDDIKVEIEIVKQEETGCHRNADYCINFYSEKKDNYLQNIGFLGEQLDLYLTSLGIGTLWFGIAKSTKVYKGLDYVILIAIAKVDKDKFRQDMYKSKRRDLEEIWQGEEYGIANVVRFSPSACNSQPWKVISKDNSISVYRKSKTGKVGIMPKNAACYYNQIDIGIFMCILEVCLTHSDIEYTRELFIDTGEFEKEIINAKYNIK